MAGRTAAKKKVDKHTPRWLVNIAGHPGIVLAGSEEQARIDGLRGVKGWDMPTFKAQIRAKPWLLHRVSARIATEEECKLYARIGDFTTSRKKNTSTNVVPIGKTTAKLFGDDS